MSWRLSDFLFDFLGLIVPGVIVIILFILTLAFAEVKLIWITNGFELFASLLIFEILPFFHEHEYILIWSVLTLFGLGSYIVGHSVKIFSKYFYELMSELFDNGIFRLSRWLITKCRTSDQLHLSDTLKKIPFLKFFYKIANIIFRFKPSSYYKENEHLQSWIKNHLEIIDIDSEQWNWYHLYRHSVLALSQKGIHNLSPQYLAKYNFYRSLSFLFFTYFIIIFFLFEVNFFIEFVQELKYVALAILAIFWVTFHDNYKTYWTLCGNEAITGYFTYLTNLRLNEEDGSTA